jgi:hypothetical protein
MRLLAANCVYTFAAPPKLNDAFPPITGDMSIVGGPNTVIRRDPAAASSFRLFSVNAGAIPTLTLEHGNSTGLGGAVSNLGTTMVRDSSVTLNVGGAGGGLSTGNANVAIDNSDVSNNKANNCNPLNTVAGCVN